MTRHGPTVRGVCRRVAGDPSDVEDAFQATFLVLVRKAGGAPRCTSALGPWLYGVAYHVAARVRARAGRRPAEESEGARPEAVAANTNLERVD